jgi:hypothetical protein
MLLCLLAGVAVAVSLGGAPTVASATLPSIFIDLGPRIPQEQLQEILDLGINLEDLLGDPVVTDVEPNGGLTSGGYEVVITGTEFSGATKVTFGGTEVDEDDFTVDSDTQITATAPLHAAGTVQVQVTTPAGVSVDTSADDFTYVAAPPTTAAPTTAPPTTAAPTTAAPDTTIMVTTSVAPAEEEGGGLSGGWIAFIVVIAVIALAALSTMVYLLGKRSSKGGPSA